MTCMCGATDCPSCGPAQGYRVLRVPRPGGGWMHINHDPDDEPDLVQLLDDEPPQWAIDAYLDRQGRA